LILLTDLRSKPVFSCFDIGRIPRQQTTKQNKEKEIHMLDDDDQELVRLTDTSPFRAGEVSTTPPFLNTGDLRLDDLALLFAYYLLL
jgi:hypothetical protein